MLSSVSSAVSLLSWPSAGFVSTRSRQGSRTRRSSVTGGSNSFAQAFRSYEPRTSRRPFCWRREPTRRARSGLCSRTASRCSSGFRTSRVPATRAARRSVRRLAELPAVSVLERLEDPPCDDHLVHLVRSVVDVRTARQHVHVAQG